jgi:hypothetical protein
MTILVSFALVHAILLVWDDFSLYTTVRVAITQGSLCPVCSAIIS